MPSHHNDSSAPPIPERSTTRKSSLRRLSSLANLQLNLFNRRRSNNATDTSSNAASITSSSSSTAHLYHNKSSPALEYSMSAFYEPPSIPLSSGISEDDESQPWLPMPEQQNLRIPKSRTFSNLPVPVRSSLRSSYLPKSQSSMLLPSSRIPTPSGNRRDSKSRLVPTSKSILKPRGNRGLPRSDTEPLLASASTEYRHKLPRITAFKENLSLSPIKPLPSLDLGERKLKFSPSPPTVTNRKVNIARHPQSLDAALASCEPTTSVTKRPELSVTQSSPIRKTATERRPNTPLGLPRYSSQPALPTATSGKRVSFGPDIRQQRLLSIKNPPTPPPKTPSNTTSLVHQSLKSVNNSGAIRKDHELIPCSEKGTPRPIPCENLDKITSAQALPYWCGRYMAVDDRYRNEHFARQAVHGSTLAETEADKVQRTRRILRHLYHLCGTAEARCSLQSFHAHLKTNNVRNAAGDEGTLAAFVSWADVVGDEESNGEGNMERVRSKAVVESGNGTGMYDMIVPTLSSTRKTTFMERLLGKTRRSIV